MLSGRLVLLVFAVAFRVQLVIGVSIYERLRDGMTVNFPSAPKETLDSSAVGLAHPSPQKA